MCVILGYLYVHGVCSRVCDARALNLLGSPDPYLEYGLLPSKSRDLCTNGQTDDTCATQHFLDTIFIKPTMSLDDVIAVF